MTMTWEVIMEVSITLIREMLTPFIVTRILCPIDSVPCYRRSSRTWLSGDT